MNLCRVQRKKWTDDTIPDETEHDFVNRIGTSLKETNMALLSKNV